MKENGENMWLKNLPTHTPPEGMWERIETHMDNDYANERFRTQLASLPEHEPPFGLWTRIEQALARKRILRLGLIASGIAATLLIAFVLKGFLLPELTRTQPIGPLAKVPIENRIPEINIGPSIRTKTSAITEQGKRKIVSSQEKPIASPDLIDREKSTSIIQYNNKSEDISFPAELSKKQEKSFAILPLEMKPVHLNSGELAFLMPTITNTVSGKNIPKNDTLSAWLLARNSKESFPLPPSPSFTNGQKGISIGFNYLPEPMLKSDFGSSAYQTFALMAQYRMRSVDFRTGLGISYQSTPIDYRTDYISISNAGGHGKDTIINKGSLDISGKERSSFLYYTLGAGKRIYSNKRLSTTLRVGAGFSLLLSNQNKLSGPVYDELNTKANTYFSNTKSNIPDINQTHFDMITGFDFNYRLLKRWSLSIEPTLKYYFNPIYNGNNIRTFSTGLRTGILFKL